MALIGYDPNPNGGYRFRKDDGSSMLAFGPEAERLKSWIDQTRGPDRRLAENDMPPPETQEQLTARLQARAKSDLASYVPAATREAQEKADAAAWNAQFDAKGNRIGSAPPAAPMQNDLLNPDGSLKEPGTFGKSAPSAAPAAASASAPYYRVGPKKVVINPADLAPAAQPSGPVKIPAPHQPPPNPAELPPMIPPSKAPGETGAASDVVQQFAANQPRPSGGGSKPKMVLAEQTTEGIQQTPEEAEATRKMLEARQAADNASLAEIKAAANEKQAVLEQQSADAADAALDAHDRQLRAQDQAATVEQAWNKTYAGLQKEQQAAANQRIDPRRLFNGENGTLNTITSALAVGLGAFGSSLTGGPNYANQIIQASIDRDINAQADAIHAKRENADNALSNFMKVHGLDVNEAKLAVRAIGQEYAANLAQIRANQIGSPQAKQDAAVIEMTQRNNAQKSWADLQAQVKAKATDKYKMVGGGGAPNRLIWTKPDANGISWGINPNTNRPEMGADGNQVWNVGARQKEGGGPEKLPARLGSQEATNESAIEDLDNFIAERKGQGLIRPDIPGVPNSDAHVKVHSLVTAIKGKVVSGSNGAVNESEMEEIGKMLDSPREEVAIEGAKRLKQALGTAHTAIERQRGKTSTGGGGTEQETP